MNPERKGKEALEKWPRSSFFEWLQIGVYFSTRSIKNKRINAVLDAGKMNIVIHLIKREMAVFRQIILNREESFFNEYRRQPDFSGKKEIPRQGQIYTGSCSARYLLEECPQKRVTGPRNFPKCFHSGKRHSCGQPKNAFLDEDILEAVFIYVNPEESSARQLFSPASCCL